MRWLLYGANGYTGRLVAKLACEYNQTPILAGRSSSVRALAEELGCEARVVNLEDSDRLEAALTGVHTVLNCAGPFSKTAAPIVDVCLRRGVNYADITGEIGVFEDIYQRHAEAVAAGVSLVPGVGFDVVPSDHLLTVLHEALPTATHAEVALIDRGGFSSGTLRTVLEGMRDGGLVRSEGRLKSVPVASRHRKIHIGKHSRAVFSMPLGDVASGFRATEIANITNYANLPGGKWLALVQPGLRAFLRVPGVLAIINAALRRIPLGPNDARRARAPSDVWVELRDESGQTRSANIRVPNTYTFTAASALHAVARLQAANVPAGAWTPSQAFGRDFALDIPGIEARATRIANGDDLMS